VNPEIKNIHKDFNSSTCGFGQGEAIFRGYTHTIFGGFTLRMEECFGAT
jgi:hypothetical protein